MKTSKRALKIIDALNDSLREYSVRNGNLFYKPIEKNDKDNYVGSISFGKFTVYICFDELDIFGYRFLETPISEEKPIGVGALLTRIKFDFSNRYFSLYDIHNVINSKEYITLDFHTLHSPENSINAFTIATEFITNNLIAINNIASDLNLQKQIIDNYNADVLALDKKSDLNCFDEDIYTSSLGFESDLYVQPKLENEIDRYLCNGNHSALLKKFYKYEDKGKVTVFEKRFVNYLIENDFPEIAGEKKNIRKIEKFNKYITGFFTLAIAIASFIIAIIIAVAIESTAIDKFFSDMTYIGVATNHELTFVLMILGIMVCIARILHFIPKIKEWTFFNNISKNITTINIISIVAVVVILISSIFEFVTYKNKSVVTDSTAVYIGAEKVENNNEIEFFHILGTNTIDENGDDIYETGEGWTDYIMVIDGDYQNYYFCEGLFDENGIEKTDSNKAIVDSGFEIIDYKTIEDYCLAHGFEFE